ncbi:hypothetical protein PHYPSEUDO_008534 [Phytophthora pseudosyringae]|uniref:Uncharacterized protein n=1 Tax=Phytophthora pseudosyringae TaxID=221518 RepID=A0A8T1VDU3_9STRA|nr:hypothetical protein PHYPSEUDO_008534 [Phytophthora pseudosyringae]
MRDGSKERRPGPTDYLGELSVSFQVGVFSAADQHTLPTQASWLAGAGCRRNFHLRAEEHLSARGEAYAGASGTLTAELAQHEPTRGEDQVVLPRTAT